MRLQLRQSPLVFVPLALSRSLEQAIETAIRFPPYTRAYEARTRESISSRESSALSPIPVSLCEFQEKNAYSQLSPCGHLAITDTPIIWAAAKSPAKINYRRLTEINSRYYGISLLRTLTPLLEGVRNKGS